MKVDSTNINKQLNVGSTKTDKADDQNAIKGDPAKDSSGAASAKVNFSQQAQQINRLRELATPDMNSIDDDKVAHFQKLIDSGSYEVDAASIADRLVDEHLIR